jgi:hypothetical protein
MVAFIPEQSPPLVSTASRFIVFSSYRFCINDREARVNHKSVTRTPRHKERLSINSSGFLGGLGALVMKYAFMQSYQL